MIIHSATSLDNESVHKFLYQSAATRVCVELRLPDYVDTADFPFYSIGVQYPVLISQDFMAQLIQLKLNCNVKLFASTSAERLMLMLA